MKLNGYKTYTIAGLAILVNAVVYFGFAEVASLDEINAGFLFAAVAALRHGVDSA